VLVNKSKQAQNVRCKAEVPEKCWPHGWHGDKMLDSRHASGISCRLAKGRLLLAYRSFRHQFRALADFSACRTAIRLFTSASFSPSSG